jgi:hypothetical protein
MCFTMIKKITISVLEWNQVQTQNMQVTYITYFTTFNVRMKIYGQTLFYMNKDLFNLKI